MTRILAFDPGEAWFGFAAMDIDFLRHKGRVLAQTAVLHVKTRGFQQTVDEALFGLPATVVTEDYRTRPVGHQRFSGGAVQRMLGALEYVVGHSRGSSWHVVQPGNASKDVPVLFGSLIADWHRTWPKPVVAEWNHAMSAWRVLGHYLLRHEPWLLAALREGQHQTAQPCGPFIVPQHRCDADLRSRGVLWTLPIGARKT